MVQARDIHLHHSDAAALLRSATHGPLQDPLQGPLHGPLQGALHGPPHAPPPARNDLPRDIPDFVGRSEELCRLLALCGREPGTSVDIKVIDGMPGVGKTALAVHAAHLLSPYYPDGQLFLDLHGHTPGQQPVDVGQALDMLLRVLGVPAERFPRSVEERAAAWRSQLVDRRILMVLDNVLDERQVRLLLPGAPGCLVLITSRRRLGGLEGADNFALDVLPQADAMSLLRRVIEPDGDISPGSPVAEVAEQCGNLPLAIRLAGARLRHHPGWTVEDLKRRLADTRRRLTELRTGDVAVAAAFHVSYRHLGTRLQQAFRQLGLHPGPHFTAHTAAALWGVTLTEADHLLEELFDAHLVEQPTDGRYWLHDLMRHYAYAQSEKEDGPEERRAVTGRVLDFYLYTVYQVDRSRADGPPLVPRIEHPPAHAPTFSTWSQALDWPEAERQNLIAAIHHAAENGWHHHAWQLPRLLWNFFHTRGYLDDWLFSHLRALAATRELKNRHGEGEVLNYLAGVYWRLGQYQRSLKILQDAVEIRREVGDHAGEITSLVNFILVYEKLGRYQSALDCYEQATRVVGYENHQGRSIHHRHISLVYLRLGRYDEALRNSEQAVVIARSTGSPWALCKALDAHGAVLLELHRYDEALESLHRAVTISQELGDQFRELRSITRIGTVHEEVGNLSGAMRYLCRALAISQETNDEVAEGEARRGVGALYHRGGEYSTALEYYRDALAIARRTGIRYHEAKTLQRIGDALAAGRELRVARRYWQQAFSLYDEMQVPEAADLRELLDQLLDQPV